MEVAASALTEELIAVFRIVAILIVSLLAGYTSGCGHVTVVQKATDEVHQEDVPITLMRTEPKNVSQIKPGSTITLYFDDVPINFAATTDNEVVKGKIVELTVSEENFSGGAPDLLIGWRNAPWTPFLRKRLTVGEDGNIVWRSEETPPRPGEMHTKRLNAIEIDEVQTQEGVIANLLRADPPDGNSIVGVDTITLYFDARPTNVKITDAATCISKVIVSGNTVEVSITDPKGPLRYTPLTVWWSTSKKRWKKTSLRYVNRVLTTSD